MVVNTQASGLKDRITGEIQTQIAAEVCKLTGLHVSCVHVVFKALISDEPLEEEVKSEESESESELEKEFSSEEF